MEEAENKVLEGTPANFVELEVAEIKMEQKDGFLQYCLEVLVELREELLQTASSLTAVSGIGNLSSSNAASLPSGSSSSSSSLLGNLLVFMNNGPTPSKPVH